MLSVSVKRKTDSNWSLYSEIVGTTGNYFGYGVKILDSHGNSLATGTINIQGKGWVDIHQFSNNTWSLGQRLTAEVATGNNQFGRTIQINKQRNLLIIGATNDGAAGSSAGAIHLFSKNELELWIEEKKITPTAGNTGGFGNSIQINNDSTEIYIGAATASLSGRLLIYRKNNGEWVLNQVLMSNTGAQSGGKNFGYTSALSDDNSKLIVGAYNEENPGSRVGAVYIYTKINDLWSFNQKLTVPAPFGRDLFGISISITKDSKYLFVGATEVNNLTSGRVYVYELIDNSFTYISSIVHSDSVKGDQFGSIITVAPTGEDLFIRSTYHLGDGALFFYGKAGGSWESIQKIATTFDSIDISDDSKVLVTASNVSGKAYIYRKA